MRKILKSILPGLFLITLATSGFAENRQGAYTLSPFVGGYFLDHDQREENRPIFGLRGGFNFTKNLGAEAMFGYSLTETKPKYGSRETDVYRYGLDILYHFMPDRNLVPFIAVGGGFTNFHTPNSPSTQDHSAGLFNYGVGFKYFVADNVALRADGRHVVLFHNIGNNSIGNNNLEFTFGLTFQFGGKKRAVAVVAQAPTPVQVPTPDTTAPTVCCTSPEDGATGVSVNKEITATFSEPMDPATFTASTVTVMEGKTPVSGAMIYAGLTATFTPASDLKPGTTYTETITTEATDKAGNALARNFVWSFTTAPAPVEKVKAAPALVEKVITATLAQKVEAALIVLSDQHFEFDKSNLTKEGMIILKQNSQILKDNPRANVRIAGYASASGTVEYNQKLSERRAIAVRDYLIKEGIAPERLTTIGYGESRPATFEANSADINSPAARSNRRVVFEVTIK